MALIICSECGKEFSDKAPACPSCGCPTGESASTGFQASNIPSFKYKDYNGTEVEIGNGMIIISKRGVIKNQAELRDVNWSDFKEYGFMGLGNISLNFPGKRIPCVLSFQAEDEDKIEQLKDLIEHKASAIEISQARKSKKIKKDNCCPRCKSLNISIANTRTKTTMNLNPLKPFTIVNHKTTGETWLCHDCGNRWSKKV